MTLVGSRDYGTYIFWGKFINKHDRMILMYLNIMIIEIRFEIEDF